MYVHITLYQFRLQDDHKKHFPVFLYYPSAIAACSNGRRHETLFSFSKMDYIDIHPCWQQIHKEYVSSLEKTGYWILFPSCIVSISFHSWFPKLSYSTKKYNLEKRCLLYEVHDWPQEFMSCGSRRSPRCRALVLWTSRRARSKQEECSSIQRDFPFRGWFRELRTSARSLFSAGCLSGEEGSGLLTSSPRLLLSNWEGAWGWHCTTAGLFHSLESQAGSSISAASVSPVPGRKSQISATAKKWGSNKSNGGRSRWGGGDSTAARGPSLWCPTLVAEADTAASSSIAAAADAG